MNRSIRFPDLGSPTFSLLGRRIAELATCELLLLVNFPSWFPVLPLYFLSYFVDNSFPPFKPFSTIEQRIGGAISRSFGLRVISTRHLASFRFYFDFDSIYIFVSALLYVDT